uniref:Gypsy retrotransposon integrase-like protein 1 n=1 Tax=Micrurus carvalhoi TaxID=3147026 RepID=A0A2H6NE63_9SAUR
MADALSRLPQYQSTRDIIIQPLVENECCKTIELSNQLKDINLDMLRTAIAQDEWLKKNPSICSYKNGLAWQGSKLYVPDNCRSYVLSICHDAKQAGHFGFLKTLHLAKRQFWWPNMRSTVKTYVKLCRNCAISKPQIGKPMGLLQSVSEPT